MTTADSRAFAEALLHPREPVPELRAASERYRKMVGVGSDPERVPALSDDRAAFASGVELLDRYLRTQAIAIRSRWTKGGLRGQAH